MMRTSVFTDQQLTEAFARAKIGDRFFVSKKRNDDNPKSEQNRVYKCASCAGRQIVMRAMSKKDGWKATVLE